MEDQKWFNTVALALAGTLVIGLLLGFGIASNSPGKTVGTSTPATAVDHVYLTIAYNPATGMDQYFPANLTLPAHTLVIFTITNYDNGTNVVPPTYALVAGATGGLEQVTYFGTTAARSMGSVPSDQISHTFTIMQAPYNLNAVVPPSANLAEPTTVEFGAYFNTTGVFAWNCMAPCDPGSMMTPGLMTGTVTVS